MSRASEGGATRPYCATGSRFSGACYKLVATVVILPWPALAVKRLGTQRDAGLAGAKPSLEGSPHIGNQLDSLRRSQLRLAMTSQSHECPSKTTVERAGRERRDATLSRHLLNRFACPSTNSLCAHDCVGHGSGRLIGESGPKPGRTSPGACARFQLFRLLVAEVDRAALRKWPIDL
jgi:hypothetical protein